MGIIDKSWLLGIIIRVLICDWRVLMFFLVCLVCCWFLKVNGWVIMFIVK